MQFPSTLRATRSFALGLAVIAAGVAVTAQANESGRVDDGAENCAAMLREDFGATDLKLGEISTRDRDRIFIHYEATLPDGETRAFRCQLQERGSDVRTVRVRNPSVRSDNGWVSADRLRVANRASDGAAEETGTEEAKTEETGAEAAGRSAPAAPHRYRAADGFKSKPVSGAAEAPETDGENARSGPKRYTVD